MVGGGCSALSLLLSFFSAQHTKDALLRQALFFSCAHAARPIMFLSFFHAVFDRCVLPFHFA